jgi:hypothetical protein
MREGTTSRVIAADRPYGEFYDFYSVSPENFGFILISATIRMSIVELRVTVKRYQNVLWQIYVAGQN